MQSHFLRTKNYYLKLRIKILFLFKSFFFLDYDEGFMDRKGEEPRVRKRVREDWYNWPFL